VRPSLALALVSAALTAVLFLLVLLLVAGWSVEPLRAALNVTVLPVAALAGARIGGAPRTRAAAGAALLGGGVIALAFLPDARAWWTVVPQAVAGVGMGLALTALGGQLLPERTTHDAARLLTLRHAGIAVILAVLAPIAAAQLDDATARAKERGVAVLLDADLSLSSKLRSAPALLRGVEQDRPRAGLTAAIDDERERLPADDRASFEEVSDRVDDVLVTAVGESFRVPFLITGAAALAAALLLAPWPPGGALLGAGALAAATVAAYGALYASAAPDVVRSATPATSARRCPAAAWAGSSRTARTTCSTRRPAATGPHGRSSSWRSSTTARPALRGRARPQPARRARPARQPAGRLSVSRAASRRRPAPGPRAGAAPSGRSSRAAPPAGAGTARRRSRRLLRRLRGPPVARPGTTRSIWLSVRNRGERRRRALSSS
jgi:hypothetical protein